MHNELIKRGFQSTISSYDNYENLNKYYAIKREHFVKINYLKYFSNKNILISYDRIISSIIKVIHIPYYNNRVIHVALNEFNKFKCVTYLPSNIIACSKLIKNNTIEYFNIPSKNIEVIYNFVKDTESKFRFHRIHDMHNIKVLYPARINGIKGQIRLVEHLDNKIPSNIKITFVGEGTDYIKLENLIKGRDNFYIRPTVHDFSTYLLDFDYVMLFSKKEGIPLSLITAAMSSKPIICNSVGGNLELVKDKINGFIANDYSELIAIFNQLPKITENNYNYLCRNSRDTYEEKFSFQKNVNLYIKYIQRLLY